MWQLPLNIKFSWIIRQFQLFTSMKIYTSRFIEIIEIHGEFVFWQWIYIHKNNFRGSIQKSQALRNQKNKSNPKTLFGSMMQILSAKTSPLLVVVRNTWPYEPLNNKNVNGALPRIVSWQWGNYMGQEWVMGFTRICYNSTWAIWALLYKPRAPAFRPKNNIMLRNQGRWFRIWSWFSLQSSSFGETCILPPSGICTRSTRTSWSCTPWSKIVFDVFWVIKVYEGFWAFLRVWGFCHFSSKKYQYIWNSNFILQIKIRLGIKNLDYVGIHSS